MEMTFISKMLSAVIIGNRRVCRNNLRSALVFGVSLPLLIFISSGIVRATNIIPDPSFENGTGNWDLLDYASSIDTTVKRTGEKSLYLLNDGDDTNHNAGQYNITGVLPGEEYVYSLWVRGNNVTGATSGGKPLAVLRWRNASGGVLEAKSEIFMWAPFNTYDWREMRINLQAPSDAAQVDISFRSWYECLTGYTNWDDVSLSLRDLSYRGSLLATYQAENASGRSGGTIENTETKFTGTGYFDPTDPNAYVEWNNISGGATGGSRILSFRYAWEGQVRNLTVLVNGMIQGTVTPAATGRENSWATSDWEVTLQPGNNTARLRISEATAGPNIDKLDVYHTAASGDGQESFGGTPWPVPGTIEAENYDTGGESVAYHDTSPGNAGSQYRDDNVDIWLAENSPEGYYVGSIASGEWLEYTTDVVGAGQYRIDLRVTTPNSGGQMQLALDGGDLAGLIAIPNTGSWEAWQTVSATANLSAGQHVLRAQIIVGGFNLNWIDLAVINYDNTAVTPTITPDGGEFSGSVEVSMETTTSGATIYYTLDGSPPTVDSTVYTAPYTLTVDSTIQAMAVAPGYNASDVVIADFVVTAITSSALTPTITPAGGAFSGSVAVSLETATPGATIYYTTNGTTPSTTSHEYAGPFTLTTDATVQAIAVAAGYADSAVSSAVFTVEGVGSPSAISPTITPDGGAFSGSVEVSLETATPGATIYYTTNGTTPSTTSHEYAGPFILTTDTTVQTIAVAAGYTNSAVSTAEFKLEEVQDAEAGSGGGGGGCFFQVLY